MLPSTIVQLLVCTLSILRQIDSRILTNTIEPLSDLNAWREKLSEIIKNGLWNISKIDTLQVFKEFACFKNSA
jgi:hypothetical protein